MGVHEDQIRRFISQSPWDHESVQESLNREIPDPFRSEEAILIVDDVDVLKKGRHSVGVSRQYAGSIGKVDNCQVAVDLVLTVPDETRNADQVTWPLGMELYLPKKWLEDDSYAHLREEVDLPDDIEFRTKLEIALDLLRRAGAADVPHACVCADAGYGESHDFRAQLRQWNEPYVVGRRPSKVRVVLEEAGPRTESRTHEEGNDDLPIVSATSLAEDIDDWTRVEWSEGTKETLSADVSRQWVTVAKETATGTEYQESGWLLLEKYDSEIKSWICWGVEGYSLEELVRTAHMRWPIEQFHKDAKQVLGLNHFEGRTWQGWNHHTTVVLLAHAYLSTQRAAQGAVAESLPPFTQVARTLIVEMATQTAQRQGLNREQAEDVAEAFIRGYTDW
jgi:SRSO17 transposase